MRGLLVLALCACTPLPEAFPCTTSAMCVDGVQGSCEASGYCSFADGACMSGRRYGELSGELANECVPGLPPRRELSFGTTADLVDFPLPVILDASRVDYALAGEDGAGLRFVDADDSLLPSEIETWDASGTSIVWVKVPRLAASTHIYLTYGTDELPDPTLVWDASFAAVWHLSSPPLAGAANAIRDSSSDAAHATARPSTAAPVPGKVGLALTFDGNLDYLATPDRPGLQVHDNTSFTLETWVRPTSFGPLAANLLRYDDCDDSDGDQVCMNHAIYALRLEADGHPNSFYGPTGGTFSTAGNPTPLALDTWHHIALVRDAAAKTNTLFYNGQQLSVRTDTSTGTWVTDGQYLLVGRFHTSGQSEPFKGELDEVRVSTIARSGPWLTAQYAAMTDQLVVFEP